MPPPKGQSKKGTIQDLLQKKGIQIDGDTPLDEHTVELLANQGILPNSYRFPPGHAVKIKDRRIEIGTGMRKETQNQNNLYKSLEHQTRMQPRPRPFSSNPTMKDKTYLYDQNKRVNQQWGIDLRHNRMGNNSGNNNASSFYNPNVNTTYLQSLHPASTVANDVSPLSPPPVGSNLQQTQPSVPINEKYQQLQHTNKLEYDDADMYRTCKIESVKGQDGNGFDWHATEYNSTIGNIHTVQDRYALERDELLRQASIVLKKDNPLETWKTQIENLKKQKEEEQYLKTCGEEGMKGIKKTQKVKHLARGGFGCTVSTEKCPGDMDDDYWRGGLGYNLRAGVDIQGKIGDFGDALYHNKSKRGMSGSGSGQYGYGAGGSGSGQGNGADDYASQWVGAGQQQQRPSSAGADLGGLDKSGRARQLAGMYVGNEDGKHEIPKQPSLFDYSGNGRVRDTRGWYMNKPLSALTQIEILEMHKSELQRIKEFNDKYGFETAPKLEPIPNMDPQFCRLCLGWSEILPYPNLCSMCYKRAKIMREGVLRDQK
ncbi:MAG: hypothetical protein EZS28_030295, partial [Streblomastix strix]